MLRSDKRSFEEIITQYNTEDILVAIIAMQFRSKRFLGDALFSTVETFSCNAVRHNITESEKSFRKKDYKHLMNLGKELLGVSAATVIKQAMILKSKNPSVDEREDFLKTSMMKMKNIAFRGDGYLFQLIDMADALYLPFDNDLKLTYGFTYTCFRNVLIHIYKEYKKRVILAYTKFCSPTKNLYKIVKTDLYQGISNGNEEVTAEIETMLNHLSINLGDKNLPEVRVEDFKPLLGKPFIDMGDYIYLPLSEPVLMNLPKIFHYDFIASGSMFADDVVEQYKKNRGDVVESYTIAYLSRFFDQDKIFQSLKYPKKEKTYKADVTVQQDDVTIFAECKSKILTLGTLKGKIESLQTDIKQAIGKAYEQGVRSIKYLESGRPFIFETDSVLGTQGEPNIEITLNNSSKKYILCVNIENFGVIPSEIEKYVSIDANLDVIPLSINLYDLEIISMECKSKMEFLSYLEFRKLNNTFLTSNDELDMFALFKKRAVFN
ncbi:hypothetical protein [Anaerocolumna aminovalerica]|uniref:hypothetical protein n=1 Tax=Anaerocolumna aminovalerica TaxID=1527 RepID=UPI000BE45E18|nr:hypothetical protein [Anaerocolumna aminovalerica]